MLNSLKLSDAIPLVKEIVSKTEVVPFLVGHSGVGKSYSVKHDIAFALGMKFVDVRLSQLEPSEVIGLPVEEIAPDGTKVTNYARPWWFPGPDDEPTLVFLDEITSAHPDVRAAILQFVLDRQIHQHVLAEQHKIVAAGNPGIGNYNATSLDTALTSRLIHFVVEADVNGWMQWANKQVQDMPRMSDVISFLAATPELLHKPSTDEKIELDITPSNRGWTMVAEILSKCDIPENRLFDVAAGLVGADAAIPFVKHCNDVLRKPVTWDEIREDYEKVRKRVLNSTHDMLTATTQDIITKCTDDDYAKHMTVEDIKKMTLFFRDIPAEFTMSTVLAVLKPSVIMKKLIGDCDELYDWLREINERNKDEDGQETKKEESAS